MTKIDVMKDFLAKHLECAFSETGNDEECLDILSKIKVISPDKQEVMDIKQSLMNVFTKYCKAENDNAAMDILNQNVILGDISEN